MALVLNDRVKESSTTTGTGTISLAGASSGFVSFVAGVGNSNTTYYTIFQQGTNNWEVGLGTVTDATPDTLARTTVINTSAGNTTKINFSGTLDVFCTYPAIKTPDMILTTQGDILYASAANTVARLAKGTAGQVLKMNSGASAPEWGTDEGASAGFAVAMAIAL